MDTIGPGATGPQSNRPAHKTAETRRSRRKVLPKLRGSLPQLSIGTQHARRASPRPHSLKNFHSVIGTDGAGEIPMHREKPGLPTLSLAVTAQRVWCQNER